MINTLLALASLSAMRSAPRAQTAVIRSSRPHGIAIVADEVCR